MINKRNGILVCLVGCLLSAGCTSHVRTPMAAPAAVAGHGGAAQYAASAPERYDNHTLEPHRSGHTLHEIRFDSTGDNGQPGGQVHGWYYRSEAPGAQPLVIVLPIWGSSHYPPQKISEGLLRRMPEAHVFRLHGDERLLDWDALAAAGNDEELLAAIDLLGLRLRTATADIRRIVAWAAQRPEVDGARIGLVGFSIGAVVGAIATANEPALAASVLVMGGARLEDIALTCPGRRGAARRHVLDTLGWTRQRYRDTLREGLAPIAASYAPGRTDPAGVLIIDSAQDECIPATARDDLWERMGRPERITYSYRHRRAFYAMTPFGFNLMRRQIYEFLERRLR